MVPDKQEVFRKETLCIELSRIDGRNVAHAQALAQTHERRCKVAKSGNLGRRDSLMIESVRDKE